MPGLSAHPVRRIPSPRYPMRLDVLADASLLEKLPPGWLSAPDVARLAAALVTLGFSGCDNPATSNAPSQSTPGANARKAALVAPVFEHGNGVAAGRGAMGCIAVAAPVYLSEEDAIQVITEELSQHGLDLTKRNEPLAEVIIHGRKVESAFDWASQTHGLHVEDVTGPLRIDLLDPVRHIGVEFVNATEYEELGGPDGSEWAVDLKATAARVGDAVRTQGEGLCVGLFYDPVRSCSLLALPAKADSREPEEDNRQSQWAATSEEAREESRRLLRMQVRDFVDWLKGQGVL